MGATSDLKVKKTNRAYSKGIEGQNNVIFHVSKSRSQGLHNNTGDLQRTSQPTSILEHSQQQKDKLE
jgi:hypothetical protein